MELREEAVIDAPREVTWPLLQDVNLVARCLPGAQLSGVDDEGRHQGTLTVQFGPSQVTFQGVVSMTVNDQDQRVEITGRGRDGRGRNRATVDLAVQAFDAPGSTTELHISGDIAVVGPLESFVATGGRHIAQELLREFTSNVAAELGGSTSTLETETSDGSRAALPAGRLLWRALLSWWRGLWRGNHRER